MCHRQPCLPTSQPPFHPTCLYAAPVGQNPSPLIYPNLTTVPCLCPLPAFPPPLPAGAQLVRINLSEQTDMMDLLGADLPVAGGAPGEFAW